MKQYSPYDNVGTQELSGDAGEGFAQRQPGAVLGRREVGGQDCATMKTDNNPLLLKVNMGAGHGGSSGRYDVSARNGV